MGIKNLNFCDGSSTANNTRVAFSSETQEVSVFPNPFENSTSLLVESSNDLDAVVTISDASVKIVSIINGSTNQSIEVNVDKPGVYFMQVKYGTEVYTTKLMKQ